MKMVALKDVAPASAAKIKFQQNDSVWQLNLDQIEAQSGRVLSKFVDLASSAGSSTQAFDQGNVLYSKLRPYLNKVVLPDEPGVATTELVPLRPDPAILDRTFLTYFLRSPRFVAWASNEVSGAKMPRVVMKAFWQQQIPLPPLAEQKRIAGILDAADALRAKRRESLAQLDTLLQSTFLDMFGDPVTNPMGWAVPKFGDIVESRLGKMLDKGKEKGGQQFPYLANYNVQWGEFRLDSMRTMELSIKDQSEFSLRKGDLLVCEGGEIGRCAIWKLNNSGIFFQKAIHRCRVDPNQMAPEYLQYYFRFMTQNGGMDDFVTSATIAHLTGAKLKKLPLPLPPLPLQQRFAAIVEKIEAQKSRQRAHLDELDALFASLQSRAFQGEL